MSYESVLVSASNALTTAWLEQADLSADCLISGYSAWSLLSALTLGAHGAARDELSAVTEVDAESVGALRALWARIGLDASTANGLWLSEDLKVRQTFAELLPSLTTGPIPSDFGVLDQWINDATAGLISEFPRVLDDDTRLVLANAVAVDVEWQREFETCVMDWLDTEVDGLDLDFELSDAAAVIQAEDSSISRFICASRAEIDVHLVAGDLNANPLDILTTAVRALDGELVITPAAELGRGTRIGCLRVEKLDTRSDQLRVVVPQFSLSAEHDLLDHLELFGLGTATDSTQGHFDRLSPDPLAVEGALQVARADFSAEGFRSATVSSAVAWMGGESRPRQQRQVVTIEHDRPFGFLAVHRPTNLVLFAGWIATAAALDLFHPLQTMKTEEP